MPRSGTGSYTGAAIGDYSYNYTAAYSTGTVTGTAALTADFGSGQVNTRLLLSGLPADGLSASISGTFDGVGTISAGTADLKGAITSSDRSYLTGSFSGSFFGPQGKEFGYAWALTGSEPNPNGGPGTFRYLVSGIAAGKKN